MKFFVVVLSTFFTLSGCDIALMRPPPPPLGTQLTGDEVKSLFTGSSLVRNEDEVPPLVVFFGEDGELKGLRSNKYTDTGTWRIDGDSVCGAWKNWYGTLSRCWEVYRSGDNFTLKQAERSEALRAKLAAGNLAIRK